MELWSTFTLQCATTLVAILAGVYTFVTWHYDEFKKRKMQFPEPTFFLGNMGPYARGKHSLADQSISLYKRYKEHRAIGFFSFRKPKVYVRDPEIIKMITVKDFDYFTDHQQFTVDEKDDVLMGKFLFGMKGHQWRSMRNLLSPAFTSSKMKAMYLLIAACGEQLGDYLEKKCKEQKDGVLTLEMRDLFSRYTNDVIATSAYGIHCDSLNQPSNEFYDMGLEATDLGGFRSLKIMLFNSMPFVMRLLRFEVTSARVTNFFVSLITDTMRVREKENIIRPDMIQLLMEARRGTLTGDDEDDSQSKDKAKKLAASINLTDEDIAAQAFLFLIAGFDTSSTLLSFLAYQLSLHPDIQQRVRQEVDDVLQEYQGRLTYDGVQKMKYLDNVVSETLRLWPPVIDIDRLCVKDYTVAATATQPAVVFKKGDGVMIPAFGLQRDPEHFPDPERFDPDRFSEENKHNIKPFTYLPFGTGPRNCIGLRFALLETKIAVASVLSRFVLDVSDKTSIPLKLAKNTFNTRPEGGLWVNIKPRSTA